MKFKPIFVFYCKGGEYMLYEKLNEQKKKMGITTEQLSSLSGVPVGTINKILRGPPPDHRSSRRVYNYRR